MGGKKMAVIKVGERLREKMFCNEKLVDFFILLPKGPLLQVTKEVDINYPYALKLLKIWKGMDLVILNKAGFRYNIFYTPKGKKLTEYLIRLRRYLKRAKIQWW